MAECTYTKEDLIENSFLRSDDGKRCGTTNCKYNGEIGLHPPRATPPQGICDRIVLCDVV
jgi:hypothetical protein